MGSKLFVSLFLFLSSWVFVGFSIDEILGIISTGGVVLDDSNDIGTCVQKLLPCQPYLKSSSAPPSTCCVPLKQMIADDTKCLCDIFNNAQLLKNFNVTQDEAMKLPEACGSKVDVSVCQKAATPSGSPSTPSTPSNSSSPNNSTTNRAAAHGISNLGGPAFIVLLGVSSIISVF